MTELSVFVWLSVIVYVTLGLLGLPNSGNGNVSGSPVEAGPTQPDRWAEMTLFAGPGLLGLPNSGKRNV